MKAAFHSKEEVKNRISSSPRYPGGYFFSMLKSCVVLALKMHFWTDPKIMFIMHFALLIFLPPRILFGSFLGGYWGSEWLVAYIDMFCLRMREELLKLLPDIWLMFFFFFWLGERWYNLEVWFGCCYVQILFLSFVILQCIIYSSSSYFDLCSIGYMTRLLLLQLSRRLLQIQYAPSPASSTKSYTTSNTLPTAAGFHQRELWHSKISSEWFPRNKQHCKIKAHGY